MPYRTKIIELLENKNVNAIIDWLQQHPLIQQPDLIRQMKIVAEEEYSDLDDPIFLNLLEQLTKLADEYEDKILDEQLASLKYDIATADMDKKMKDVVDAAAQMRTYAIECIVNNEPNAPQMKELAQQIIKFEKDAGTYDAKNWEGVF